ncbi:RidA family protein [Salinicoccus halodurans]|uniref:Enamine deaminase RidA, house cleaning of reactive enamine intermediates, YjgF/YER057c/UK114 family n=1 Tax=Salinicoccus halodurans TaxID=407035 RepID=A0A0F7HKI8_9STAP|nr:RidA family protein [Salinicoccus halodurans]AKG73592.1 endoribonuclease L-PSP [Salinicoccus halodurans]SFK53081.1 Enamine deaminase RidA, house cleaning of reactive enamine intermediates, YjgF/YER057c/UK114 family [Salinicoccus halodurans]
MKDVVKYQPKPKGNYTLATRFENIIYTAGMTPTVDGVLIKRGKLMASHSEDTYRQIVQQATCNALTAAENALQYGEEISQVINMTIYINAEERLNGHARLADFASAYLSEELGERGIGSRTTVGVSSLPGDAPVEVQLVVGVK